MVLITPTAEQLALEMAAGDTDSAPVREVVWIVFRDSADVEPADVYGV